MDEAMVLGVEPITERIDMASKVTGTSPPQLYELIRDGQLETVKGGKNNLMRRGATI